VPPDDSVTTDFGGGPDDDIPFWAAAGGARPFAPGPRDGV